MHIAFVFTLLAAIALGGAAPQLGGAETAGEVVWGVLLTLLAMGVTVAGAVVLTAYVRNRGGQPQADLQAWLALHDRLQNLHGIVWICMSAIIILVLRWPQIVRFHWQIDGWPLVDELLILAPVALPLLISWAIYPLSDGSAFQWRRSFAYIAWRSSGSSLVLLPVAIFLAWLDMANLLLPGVLQSGQAWMVYAAPLLIAPLLLPLALRKLWASSTRRPATGRTLSGGGGRSRHLGPRLLCLERPGDDERGSVRFCLVAVHHVHA